MQRVQISLDLSLKMSHYLDLHETREFLQGRQDYILMPTFTQCQ